MKIFAWILCVFSCIGVLGILNEFATGSATEYSLIGLLYGGAAALFAGLYIWEQKKKKVGVEA